MKDYIWNILIWIDQGVNTVFGFIGNIMLDTTNGKFGNPDETLSSVFGKNQNNCRACKLVCKLLNKFDNNHCKDSIEEDE